MPDSIALHTESAKLGTADAKRASSLKDAAGKFEALLITQMLKSARDTDGGGWSGEVDQATSSVRDMADQQLAELLGSQGSLGLARMVIGQLSPRR